MPTRRRFLSLGAMTGALTATGLPTLAEGGHLQEPHSLPEPIKTLPPPARPVIVTRVTGDNTIQEAYQMLLDGVDTLEAAHHICLGRENDPNDHSVGLGGLPNEDGVVELDSCCMHGPTRQAGSVAAVRNLRNVCLLAKKVYQHTAHVMLCGQGAEQFGVDLGMKREDLLTDDARKIWMLWKESHSQMDWWGPPMADPAWKDPYADRPAPKATTDLHGLSEYDHPKPQSQLDPAALQPADRMLRSGMVPRHPTVAWMSVINDRALQLARMAADLDIDPARRRFAVEQILWPTTGTIHVSCVNAKGELSGTTTTSGTAWKLAGRVGDSPILGAGSWTDPDVGSAGATGSGEENIKIVGAHTIVELMRFGYSPKEAGLEALRRIVRNYNGDMRKLRYLDMEYYIVRKDGAYAGVSLWSTGATGKPREFAVHDGNYRVEPCAGLLEGTMIPWPPF
jgi:N4-(beta-N-acetylglucosaminyl)-L-asparaginase